MLFFKIISNHFFFLQSYSFFLKKQIFFFFKNFFFDPGFFFFTKKCFFFERFKHFNFFISKSKNVITVVRSPHVFKKSKEKFVNLLFYLNFFLDFNYFNFFFFFFKFFSFKIII